jgi:hypothetical protein
MSLLLRSRRSLCMRFPLCDIVLAVGGMKDVYAIANGAADLERELRLPTHVSGVVVRDCR